MKKRLLQITMILCLGVISSYAQSVKITAIVEGDCPSGTATDPAEPQPRLVELYVSGTVDVTNLKLQMQLSSTDFWVLNNSIGAGEFTDTYLYVTSDIDAFNDNFPGINTGGNTTIGTFIASVDGGDKIRLVDSANSDQVIDVFGIDGQNGESTSWNYGNSYAKRNEGTGPNATFDVNEWTVEAHNTLLQKGVCWGEDPLNIIVQLQSYTLSIGDVVINKKEHLYAYPNPSSTAIYINNIEGAKKYELYNVYGQKVLEGKVKQNQAIGIEKLTRGMYLLQLENGKNIKITKG